MDDLSRPRSMVSLVALGAHSTGNLLSTPIVKPASLPPETRVTLHLTPAW